MLRSLRRNAYDDVADFEICGFHKNKGYFIPKHRFVAEVIFNLGVAVVNFEISHVLWQLRFVSNIFTITFFQVSAILPTTHLRLKTFKLDKS